MGWSIFTQSEDVIEDRHTTGGRQAEKTCRTGESVRCNAGSELK